MPYEPPADTFVTITHGRLRQLEAASARLAALKRFGVDNWEGYDDAMAFLRGDGDEATP